MNLEACTEFIQQDESIEKYNKKKTTRNDGNMRH